MNLDSEKYLENTLQREVKKKGGRALKWVSPGFNGVPDRIVLLPRKKTPGNDFPGRVIFVELKSKGVEPSAIQLYVHDMLRSLGFEVHVIDNYRDLVAFTDSIEYV